jgi:uracil-DNA glycosylase family 4
MSYCNFIDDDKELLFGRLVDSVQNCTLCPSMESRTGVLSELNGNIFSNLLFIAEAPGRLGADKTRVPLFGDQTGVNFQKLIDTIGWSREDFFITNAVLCNPRSESGNNATPCKNTLGNCAIYLKILIDIMNPQYVVTLGQKALDAINVIEKINIRLKDNVRTAVNWNGRTLIPLYHMGPRALIHRNFYRQLSDFYWLQNTVKLSPQQQWERVKRSHLKDVVLSSKFYPSKLQKLVVEILRYSGKISKLKLTKLIYLTDYNHLRSNGNLLTNSFYLRAYAGPLPMGLDKQIDELVRRGFIHSDRNGIYLLGQKLESSFTDNELNVINIVLSKHMNKTDKEIISTTYLTLPMKRILRAEKHLNQSMIWKPVFADEDFQQDIKTICKDDS